MAIKESAFKYYLLGKKIRIAILKFVRVVKRIAYYENKED